MLKKILISMTAVTMLFGTAVGSVYAKQSTVFSGIVFADEAPAPAPSDDKKDGEGKPAEENK